MHGMRRGTLARAVLGAVGACLSVACVLGGGENPPALAGHFGNRLEGLTREQQLDSSRKALEMMKAKTGGKYRYRSSFTSWAGFGSETWVWVEGDAVVRRDYASRDVDSLGRSRPGPAWTETGSQVGAHEEGHPPLLLDSLYRTCREILAQDTTHRRMFFTLDGDYILASCGFVDDRCADDCYQGVSIEVRWD